MNPQFLLASRSPRRRQLLQQLGLAFECRPADVAEVQSAGQHPGDYAVAMALAKARAAAAAGTALPVLGADTDVVVDGEILGKPSGREQALGMLARLSGRTHEVYSAVAVIAGKREESVLSVTRVMFGPVSAAAAEQYWETGEPADKAGAYAIQGLGAVFVKEIRGSYSGVVGLPLFETCRLLERFGILPLGAGLPSARGPGAVRAGAVGEGR